MSIRARLRVTPGFFEVGTYTMKGARNAQIVADITETMERAR